MEIERLVVVEWANVQAVVFKCTQCEASIAIPRTADTAKINDPPQICPSGLHKWNKQSVLSTLKQLQDLVGRASDGFKVLLQFDEPTKPS